MQRGEGGLVLGKNVWGGEKKGRWRGGKASMCTGKKKKKKKGEKGTEEEDENVKKDRGRGKTRDQVARSSMDPIQEGIFFPPPPLFAFLLRHERYFPPILPSPLLHKPHEHLVANPPSIDPILKNSARFFLVA